MLANKHVVIALIVAPLLGLFGWFAVGSFLGENPAPAQPGQVYPMLAKSNCRYASGECELSNNDLELRIRAENGTALALELIASHPLQSVLMSVTDPANDPGPTEMQRVDSQGLRWRFSLSAPPKETDRLRVVVGSAGSAYFAEASTLFLQRSEAPWMNR